jgi:hypothetical protein
VHVYVTNVSVYVQYVFMYSVTYAICRYVCASSDNRTSRVIDWRFYSTSYVLSLRFDVGQKACYSDRLCAFG